MTEINRYALLMDAYTELKPEIEKSRQIATANEPHPVPSMPPLDEVLDGFGPMPREALYLGVASDGLPVLLNLHDPIPGPLLIVGDPGTGKTNFLHTIARAAEKMHQPEELQFGALTNHPDEWSELETIPNNVGIFPLYHRSSEDFILSLASWAHGNKTSKQSVLLLLDDLEAVSNLDFDSVQNLRWLLLRGPARRVWPIITLSTQSAHNMEAWLEAFRTRIFGNVQDPENISRFDSEEAKLQSLIKGSEYAMREGENWLRFWIPSIE
ncbi:MAG: NACHT domain-containing protein [Anaerolineae bacterium]|nr:NACHT domain-containing protein [Anaerolineae bacterium]